MAVKSTDAWKRKEWYNIVAPKMFESKTVATTPCDKPQKLIGRVIKVPLSDITGNMKQQFTKLWFKVVEVKGNDALTELSGFEIAKEFVRRNVRRGRSLIKTIKDVKTKDGKDLRVTAYVFTAHKVEDTKKNEIRKMTTNVIENTAKEADFEKCVQKYIFGNTVTEIFRVTKKIAQIRRIEIAKCKVLEPKKEVAAKKPETKIETQKEKQEKPETEVSK